MRDVLAGLGFIYSFLSVIVFVAGASQANTGQGSLYKGNCIARPTKIERFFPAYKLGCYLFSNQDHYYGE